MRPGRGGQAFGRRGRSGQGSERAMAAQERAEDRDWRAVRLAKLRGLAHEPAVEGQPFDPARLERSLDAFIESLCAAFVSAAPKDTACVGGARHQDDRFLGVALNDIEPRAAGGEGKLHCGQQLGEAPFRRAAQGTRAAAELIVDIDEERGLLRRGVNRRLVVKAEIVTQPDDVGACAQGAELRVSDRSISRH